MMSLEARLRLALEHGLTLQLHPPDVEAVAAMAAALLRIRRTQHGHAKQIATAALNVAAEKDGSYE